MAEDRDRLAAIVDPAHHDAIEKRPMPSWLSPMLATLTDERFSDPDWIFERKLDGERALAWREGPESVRLLTRNRKDIGDTYPELVDALRSQQGRFVVDGEVVAFSGAVTSFSRLQQRMQISDPDEARARGVPVTYYLFDILQYGDWCLERLPLRERKKVLKRVIDFQDPLRFSQHRNERGEALFAEACDRGWEGLIAKDAGAAYVHSRSRSWLKFKCGHGQELVIGGFTEPRGSRPGFGALLVGYYEGDRLCYAGKVGTGFDHEFLRDFRSRLDGLARKTSPFCDGPDDSDEVTWVTPKLVGEFGFTEWTDAGRLRHPRFLGLRRDKQARDVVRERPDSA